MLKKFFKEEDSLEKKVIRVQQGDETLRNTLLHEYQPFIRKTVSNVCKRYITTSHEEFSIGMLAFNESMDKFTLTKGSSFISFASLVIKRRIIDFIRKENSIPKPYSLDQTNEDDEETNLAIVSSSIAEYTEQEIQLNRKEEIIQFKERLKEYGINFEQLVKVSPKHADAREKAIDIARLISSHSALFEKLLATKRLPIADIEKLVPVSRKTIERQRIYIIAIFIVLTEDYVFLKDFLQIGGAA